MQQENLFGKTLTEIRAVTEALSLPAYTAGQIADWLYKKHVSSIDEMTNLSKAAREKLKGKFEVIVTGSSKAEISADGTKKYLFPAGIGRFIESAYIPETKRNTLCISSQVGCKMGCLFCMTGKQGFQGQLTTAEILNQIRSIPERELLTNVVYMGMGEPMDNIDEVLRSLEIITADYGYGWSPKRVTVSSIGIIPGLKRLLDENRCHIAISLHSPFVDERKYLMPVEQVYPIRDVLELLKKYDFTGQRRVSFEYIMFRGINDTPRHVNELARLLNGVKCRINLIRFHPLPSSPLACSDEQTIRDFMDRLNNKGIVTTLRASRGQDINAACGLLSTKELIRKQSAAKENS